MVISCPYIIESSLAYTARIYPRYMHTKHGKSKKQDGTTKKQKQQNKTREFNEKRIPRIF